jgi:GGDEF domain-containing protein
MPVLMDGDDLTRLGGSMPSVLDRLGEAMERAERQGARLAVLHVRLDLDGEAGLEAVRGQVALRLTNMLRASDAVLPGGPDRLLLLLLGVESVGDAATVARKLLGALAEPVMVAGASVRVDARIGVAIYPDHGFDPDALLRNAEEAMRRTEIEGGPEVRWHAPRSTVAGRDHLAS